MRPCNVQIPLFFFDLPADLEGKLRKLEFNLYLNVAPMLRC